MHNTLVAAAGTVGVWLIDHLQRMGHLPFWLALLVAAFLAYKSGRAVHRIVIRGDP
ncbi:hypothetical protein [Zhengella mangrovi]|uniref:hypothetical protein n=1 Tax=Zhengella mangrovi TaxID=1982044 RepID=UPI0013FD4025|nr:hypothetical protein [Zhengella mangrovi]